MKIDPIRYYLNPYVTKEIVEYCRGRWVALDSGGPSRKFIRYDYRGKPLKIESLGEYREIFYRYRGLGIRTIYSSINIYGTLERKGDLSRLDNILYTSPIWDIDGSLQNIKGILEAAEIITSHLSDFGIDKSIYLIWSGRGVHIHIHERAFSTDILRKIHPLDIAYSIVEYIIRKNRDKLRELSLRYSGSDRPLKIENVIDIQRVFTVPLSLHRSIDFAAIAFKPNELNSFSLEWADPERFRHNPNWREYEVGEADELAYKAFDEVGGYISSIGKEVGGVGRERIFKPVKNVVGGIGRFQIMGLLQAVRYYILYGDMDKAKSFGLNRAIFYAWAKYRGPASNIRRKARFKSEKGRGLKPVDIGGEKAFINEDGWFIIGGKVQKPEDFDYNIKRKIERSIPFNEAWDAAVNYVKSFPKEVIKDQRMFYEKVYKPVRDDFIGKVYSKYLKNRS